MAPRPANRLRLDSRVAERLAEVIALHPRWSPSTVLSELTDDLHDLPETVMPSLRTVQAKVKAARESRTAQRDDDDGRLWRITDLPVEDAALVLGVLQALPLIDDWPTRRQAVLIAMIRRVAPEVPRAIDTFNLARFASWGDAGLERVTACLATAPWGPPPQVRSGAVEIAGRLWARLQDWEENGRWSIDAQARVSAEVTAAREARAQAVPDSLG